MNEIMSIEQIKSLIYIIRGQKVMLDSDLAKMYGIETKRLNEQVKRNLDRFPPDFMFQLNAEEFFNLKSHFATSNWGGRRKLPYVFTEQGVAMLSSVLNSKQAVQVNIQIMRTFVRLRQLLLENKELSRRLDDLEAKYDKQFKVVFEAIRQIMAPESKPRRRIGFQNDESKEKDFFKKGTIK